MVSGPSPIFCHLAAELCEKAGNDVETFLGHENSVGSVPQIIASRVKKFGLVRGLDQVFMRVIDILFLRSRVEGRFPLSSSNPIIEDSNINSKKFRDFVIMNGVDIVVCLGTSIVSREMLHCPKEGIINVHPGYLPNYRGLGNFWAVVNDDWEHVGVSCHWLNEGIDTGPLIWREKIEEIPRTYWELTLAALTKGTDFLAQNLASIVPSSDPNTEERFKGYSWFGLGDYLRFITRLRKKRTRHATG